MLSSHSTALNPFRALHSRTTGLRILLPSEIRIFVTFAMAPLSCHSLHNAENIISDSSRRDFRISPCELCCYHYRYIIKDILYFFFPVAMQIDILRICLSHVLNEFNSGCITQFLYLRIITTMFNNLYQDSLSSSFL